MGQLKFTSRASYAVEHQYKIKCLNCLIVLSEPCLSLIICFSACHVRFFSLISPLFHLSVHVTIFLHVSMDNTLQCEAIRSVLEIFVHTTYTNYQVWSFPVLSGNYRARYWGSPQLGLAYASMLMLLYGRHVDSDICCLCILQQYGMQTIH